MKIDHVSILVRDMNIAIKKFSQLLAKGPVVEEVAVQKVTVAFFELENCKLELVCPYPDNLSLQKRLAKHGEGIHHIAIGGIRIEATSGLEFLNTPEQGADGKQVRFLAPQEYCGTLLEIIN